MTSVLVDARGVTFRPSGARTRLRSLLRAQSALGDACDVTVLAAAGRGAGDVLADCDVEVVEIPPSRRGVAARALRDPVLERFAADVVHLETLPVPLASSRPVLLTVHDLRASTDPDLASSHAKAIYERRILPLVAPRALAGVVAVSTPTAEDVVRLLRVDPSDVHVVPNAVERPADRPAPSGIGRPFLLALGHVEPRKGLELLLPALDLAARDPLVPRTLVVAGRDLGGVEPLLQEYRAMPDPPFELVVDTDVGDEQRDALLHDATCLLAPSLVEGFGMVPLEALALGTPSVVSDLPALREALGSAACFADPRDPAGFAAAVVRTCHAPEDVLDGAEAVLRERTWASAARRLHAVWTAQTSGAGG